MAFDQVSLFFYSSRWKLHSIPDSQMTHFSGEPVRIVSAVRDEESRDSPVPFDELCSWFKEKGFEIVDRKVDYARFYSAGIESFSGEPRSEIVVHASAESGEVTTLYFRFQLNRETPIRLERWKIFTQELGEKFTFRISLSDTEYVGPEDLLTAFRGTHNWRYYAKQFNWFEPSDE